MDGFTATEQLRKVITRGIRKQILEDDSKLTEKGSLEIIEDENDLYQLSFRHSSRDYSKRGFL